MKQEFKWPVVVVISVLIVVLGFLAWADKNATTVLAGVIAVLGALGFGYQFSKTSELQQSQTEIKQTTDTIKDQTNGRISQMMSMLERQNQEHRKEMSAMADKLATMTPPVSPTSGIPLGEEDNSSHL